ncbi:MAG: hypothetical protein JWN14_5048 [Chthonomonadales bacterium]|nr:hypothetical protein [Chthonomonadales bacterium]
MISNMLKEQGDLIAARQCREDAMAIARREIKHDGMIAMMLFGFAVIAKEQGEVEDAQKCFAESLALEHVWLNTKTDTEVYVCLNHDSHD